MLLQIISGFAVDWIEQSWTFSMILVKYLIIFVGIESYLEEGLDFEHFKNLLLHYSEEVLAVVTILGLANIFVGLELQPVARLPSQIIAMVYFGFLFWKF